MKKNLVVFIILFLIIIAVFYTIMINYRSNEREIQAFNKYYEENLNKTLLGSDVATTINKATNSNERNGVTKGDNGMYIDNETNSIRVFVRLSKYRDYYPMETITSHDITEFMRTFNLADFNCTKIIYHDKTKKVAEVYFDILED